MKKSSVLVTSLILLGIQCGVQANFTDNFRSEYGKELCLEYVEVYNINKKNIDPQGPGFIYSKQGKNWFSLCQIPSYHWNWNSDYTEFKGYETLCEHLVDMYAESKAQSYPYKGIEILRNDAIFGIDDIVYSADMYNGLRWKMKDTFKIENAAFDLHTVKALLTGEVVNNRIKFLGSGKEDLFGETFTVEKYIFKQDDSIASLDDRKMKMMGIQNQSAKSLVQSLTWICKLFYRDNGELVYFTSFGRDVDRDNGAEKMKVRTSLETQMYLNRVVGRVRPRYYQVTGLTKEFDVEGYNELKNYELKTIEEVNAISQQMVKDAKANYEQEQQDVRNEMAREFEENRRQQVADGMRQSKRDYAKMKIRQAPLERRMQRIKKK
ncbi:MAG: hypothetical protein MJ048_03045 [Acidaminococcaceae bacterium]|nr:hypothetical protein [Acidaminococcaceae bacterium]